MNNAFGYIPEDLLQQAQEAWEFKTCQRSDGTTYGTSGDCAQKGAKEVKKSSKKSSWDPGDNLSGKMGAEVAQIAAAKMRYSLGRNWKQKTNITDYNQGRKLSYPSEGLPVEQRPVQRGVESRPRRDAKTSSASSNSSNDKNRFPTPELSKELLEYKNKKQQGGKASVVVPNWLLKSTAWQKGSSIFMGDGNGGRIPKGEYQLQQMLDKYASMDEKGRAQWKQWYATAAAQAKKGQIPKNPYAGVWTAADKQRGSRVMNPKELSWEQSPAGQLRGKLVSEDSKNCIP